MIRKILALDVVRATLVGLGGVVIGILITLLVRQLLGIPAWDKLQVMSIGVITGVISFVLATGVLKYWLNWMLGSQQKEEHHGPVHGWARYFNVSYDHKVIGIQYLVTALAFLPFGVALQVLGRLHVAKIGVTALNPQTYLSAIGDHGIVLIFIVIIPAFAGLMNYLVPLMIGARDLAFPRLNAFSFWLLPPAGLLTAFSLAAGGFDTGWTVYPPLSTASTSLGMNLILLGVYLSGFSSILTGVNILTTIFKMRAPGMTFFRMPISVWSALATAGLILVFTQFVAMSFLMVLLDRMLGMNFFNSAMGGSVILYQHLFWFYSHPAVYVFVLMGLGVISDVIPVFVRKPLFGYSALAIASPGIAIGGSFVWGHHMFAAGMESFLRIPFMITTLLVAVPTGVKIFGWVATIWMGKLRLKTPFLFVLSSIVIFLIGGLTGVPLGIIPFDLYITDTYFVVAHFHGTIFGGFLLPLAAAIYYWFPKASGRMLNENLGRIQWVLMTVGSLAMMLPAFQLGLEGMRRRISDYNITLISQPLHVINLVAAVLVFIGILIFIYNISRSIRHGEPSGDNPWNAQTLEWQTSSPPPEENFPITPRVVGRPYGYGIPDSVHAVFDSEPGKNK